MAVKKRRARRNEAPRFYREVVLNYDGTDCLIWPFATTKGYGNFWLNGQRVYVHRQLCEDTHGPAPSHRHQAAHSCGMGQDACCAKRHIDWKTPKENCADTLGHGTRSRGEKHGAAKLNRDQVLEIRALKGRSRAVRIAERFGVSDSLIRMIHNRKAWSWL